MHNSNISWYTSWLPMQQFHFYFFYFIHTMNVGGALLILKQKTNQSWLWIRCKRSKGQNNPDKSTFSVKLCVRWIRMRWCFIALKKNVCFEIPAILLLAKKEATSVNKKLLVGGVIIRWVNFALKIGMKTEIKI